MVRVANPIQDQETFHFYQLQNASDEFNLTIALPKTVNDRTRRNVYHCLYSRTIRSS